METSQQDPTAPDPSSAVRTEQAQDGIVRKGYLTEEQARIINLLRGYEKAYVSQSTKNGCYLVLNGDITEHIRNVTLKALITKRHLRSAGIGKWKLTE